MLDIAPQGRRTLVLDWDGTVSMVEGVNDLGHHCGVEVSALTERAVRGEVALDEIFAERLERMRPRREDLEWAAEHYATHLIPDAAETIRAFRRVGWEVHILSGGFLNAIAPVATRLLGLDGQHIHAVALEFHADGTYAGYDRTQPLARRGGKAATILQFAPDRSAVLVGDGATDLEAREAVRLFIGFGGVWPRRFMEEGSDVYIAAPSLAPLLPLLLSASPLEMSAVRSHHEVLWSKGSNLLRTGAVRFSPSQKALRAAILAEDGGGGDDADPRRG